MWSIMPWSIIFLRARPRATQPAVTEAARVPPSAWMTSQSTMICRLAEGPEVGDGPQGPADEALDLLGPPGDAAGGALPGRPFGRRPGQHGVLGRDPAPAGALEERRHPLVDRGRGQDAGPPHLDDGRAVGEIEGVDGDLQGPELGRRALAGTDGIHYLIQMAGALALLAWAMKSSRSFWALADSVSALRSLS